MRVKVYRIQDDEGRGPFRPGFSQHWCGDFVGDMKTAARKSDLTGGTIGGDATSHASDQPQQNKRQR